METITYVSGGKLGDFIHMLWIVREMWLSTGKKARLFLSHTDGGSMFSMGLEHTYKDLYEIVSKQEYIDYFGVVYENTSLPLDYINLNRWRRNKNLNVHNWKLLFSETYNINNPSLDIGWIKWNNSIPKWKEYIIIHQSLFKPRIDPNFDWTHILQNNKCIFVTCDINEYNHFPYRNLVDVYKATTLTEMYDIISNCKCLCGNLSSPVAIATSLGKPVYIQLPCGMYDSNLYINFAPNVYYKNKVPPKSVIDIGQNLITSKIL